MIKLNKAPECIDDLIRSSLILTPLMECSNGSYITLVIGEGVILLLLNN
jgi:hypothetical protein